MESAALLEMMACCLRRKAYAAMQELVMGIHSCRVRVQAGGRRRIDRI
jgi:hypothetical protein